jgi:hypothetical protein
MQSPEQTKVALYENVARGWMEVVGDQDGQPIFAMTEEGKRAVRDMAGTDEPQRRNFIWMWIERALQAEARLASLQRDYGRLVAAGDGVALELDKRTSAADHEAEDRIRTWRRARLEGASRTRRGDTTMSQDREQPDALDQTGGTDG